MKRPTAKKGDVYKIWSRPKCCRGFTLWGVANSREQMVDVYRLHYDHRPESQCYVTMGSKRIELTEAELMSVCGPYDENE